MPPHSMSRETGIGHHRAAIESIHEIGWRGSMQSTILALQKGKPGGKAKQNRTKVRQMDLASRREDWLAARRRVLQNRGQETEEVILEMEGDGKDDIKEGFWQDIELAVLGPQVEPSHEGNDYPDVLTDLNERLLLLSGHRNWPKKYKTISRRERLARVEAEWSRQLDTLTNIFLRCKHGLERIDPLQEDIEDGWRATTLSMGRYCPDQLFPYIDDDPFVNISLIKGGYLGFGDVQHRIKVALGHREKDWTAKNVCLCCTYELEGEEPLKYQMLLEIDGNNSIKRDVTSGQANPRTFDTSELYIPHAFVNLFHDEVNRTGRKREDGSKSCTDNWKADVPDAEKKAWDAFDETGFFISSYRHQVVITICDMIWSGE
ncbi:hypothetical protein FRC00_012136, partial [Tulasnella sp. 408]